MLQAPGRPTEAEVGLSGFLFMRWLPLSAAFFCSQGQRHRCSGEYSINHIFEVIFKRVSYRSFIFFLISTTLFRDLI